MIADVSNMETGNRLCKYSRLIPILDDCVLLLSAYMKR